VHYQSDVNNLVKQIIELPTSQRAELLSQTYIRRYQQALRTANIYRLWLFLFSLVLLGSISAYIIYKLRKSSAIIQQAEEKYRSIFENSVEGIFQSTPDGRYLSANPSLVELYGYESLEELCASITDIEHQLYVLPDRRAKFMRLIEEKGCVSDFESQVYCKDGSVIWISETARAVRDRNGNLLYYEGTVANITARKQAEEALRIEQEKSELLLLNILPKPIADRLKQNPQSIADSFADVTVLFADLVNFTRLSEQISPTELVEMLNRIFSAFDVLAEKHGLEKIKTIGDSYMVVGGLPMVRPDHAEAIAEMALDMISEIIRFNAEYNEAFNIRLGINTGPVVAGVIGIKKFIYDLWGDTVNTASRMESHGVPGCIQVTEATYQRLHNQYVFEERGVISVKGKGEMMTYFLTGRRKKEG
jgi:PAS domain S-box-containing protein